MPFTIGPSNKLGHPGVQGAHVREGNLFSIFLSQIFLSLVFQE